ncbi:MAG: hypothetical protein IK097_00650 [Clostridia bacterium]|nr:hypothetical protein [Clostridia bacterium]
MTNKEAVGEYRRIMSSVDIPSDAQAKIINKALSSSYNYESTNKYLSAVIAVSGIAAVAAGIGAVKLVNKFIKAD